MKLYRDALNWLQDWFIENYDNARIEIVTLENPGWSLRIKMPGEKRDIYCNDRNEEEWIFSTQTEEEIFEGDGGVNSLSDLISAFALWINKKEITKEKFLEENDTLHWIQDWYASNCKNDLGHTYEVVIKSKSKIGWNVSINLPEKIYSNTKPISKKNEGKTESDWYSIRIYENKFVAMGGLKSLVDIFREFKDWINSEPEIR